MRKSQFIHNNYAHSQTTSQSACQGTIENIKISSLARIRGRVARWAFGESMIQLLAIA